MDLVEQFAYPLPLLVIFELLGVPDADQPEIQRGVEAVAACMLSVVPPEEQVDTVRRVLAYERYLVELIAQRRAEPRDDLISTLVQSIDSGRARRSLPELVATLSTNLILAGHETTVKAIGNRLYFLGFFRTTTEPVEVRGVTIPAGENVRLLYSSGNRNEEHFPQPHGLRPPPGEPQ